MSDLLAKYKDVKLDEFDLKEVLFKSGKKVLSRVYVPDDDNIILMYMPVEYTTDSGTGIKYKKVFNASDALMFAFPDNLFIMAEQLG
jgi:hypothetical protein